ncbi:septum site-determining protein MinC [Methylomonas sp. MgM2]
MSSNAPNLSKVALEFKSTSLTIPVLLLASNDMGQIELQLQEKIAQAPEFFKNSPLLIDFQKLNNQNFEIAVRDIVDLLRDKAFMPIGIRGGTEQQNQDALALNLPVHSIHGSNTAINNTKPEPKTLTIPEPESEEIKQTESVSENKLITYPIRSGQRVYAKGDLIVTATVSAGAEIMAEGNIHVYGALRGRALAGVLGNVESRIFCSDLAAELISIAGIYKVSDDIDPETAHRPVQISLNNQTLIIQDI